jgi:anti-sigma B factor antagonist
MDEHRRTLLAELQELSLETAVERLLELRVLDPATLASRRAERLRDWRTRPIEDLRDELEALRREARQQRRHAAAQIEEARRQRGVAGAARDTIVQLDEHRDGFTRRHRVGAQVADVSKAMDGAHAALAAALAARALLEENEPSPEHPDATRLVVEEERAGERIVLRFAGEIDIATAQRLQDALDAAMSAGAAEIWIDLTAVRFIDSTGIAALLRATAALPGPRRLAVICPDGPARRALELCGLGKVLALYGDRTSAVFNS